MGKLKNPFIKRGQKYKIKEKNIISVVDEETQMYKKYENQMYWIRTLSGIGSALLGRLVFQLIGWNMLFWMIGWWFGFPWITSFLILRVKYDKKKWDWKMIMKTGIGAFFFLFMLTATIAHTLIVMNDPTLDYATIFQNPNYP
jgi:hypothetical protein